MSLLSWITVTALVLAAAGSALAWRRWQDASYVLGVGIAAWITADLAGLPAWPALAVAGYGSVIALVLRRSRRVVPRVAALLAGLGLVTAVFLDVTLPGRSDLSLGTVVTAGLVGAGWLLLGTLLWRRYEPARSSPTRSSGRAHPIAIVINPAKYSDGGLAIRSLIQIQAKTLGLPEPDFRETTPLDAGLGQARELVQLGTGLVIACGGDGTVRACADALAGTTVALGIVPVGTGNLLARNLGLPMEPGAAVEVALHGRERRIDLGVVEGQRFAVMAGIGFDAAMVAGTSERLKSGMGWPAYLLSGAKHLFGDIMRVTVRIDDGPELQRRARLVLVGNVGRITGGIPLLPDAAPDDGLLDVVILTPRTLVGWVHVAGRVLTRRRGTSRPVERHRGKRVEVRADKPQPRELDGDNIPDAVDFVAEIEPATLTVRVP
ncbi:MAG: diacylglycerol kinase family lipid kinase [Sporichthyaceae bacterium]|nr:diacylglycerol kinase family lipid kinase [Sporichthyaceae bacterium]